MRRSPGAGQGGNGLWLILAAATLAVASAAAGAQSVLSEAGVLPEGSRIGVFPTQMPRQILTVEKRGGRQSYLVALGNMAFSAPGLLGGTARKAGLSCESCHSEGVINDRFFIPGVSARPGSADVTHRLFNPQAADGLDNPLNIPSLRGLRFTAPYGHDGRFSSLREFTRNVIVNEFAGVEPSPLILDALVEYMRQFAFLPNPKLGPAGRLTEAASEAAHRGAAIFRKPFAGMGGRSCASCHVPSSGFTDGEQHAVGTGQPYETPTLLNANFTAPYFATGSAADYGEVVDHFNGFYDLGLSAGARRDLVAYLRAVGDGKRPVVAVTFDRELAEVLVFAGTLPRSLREHRAELVRLTVNTMNAELREIRERWPGAASRDTRAVLANWVLQLRRVDLLSHRGAWDDALVAYRSWRDMVKTERIRVARAVPESLYRPENRAAYLARFDEMLALPAEPPRPPAVPGTAR